MATAIQDKNLENTLFAPAKNFKQPNEPNISNL